MDLLKLMRSFVAVAEAGSFSRGAHNTGVSPAAVTRDVAALEAHLGVRLLQRTTRLVKSTAEGNMYLSHAKRILADINEANTAIHGSHGKLVGPVSVTAPATFGRLHVTPEILTFAKRHPELTLRAVYVDRVVDLLEEGIDVAVRIGHLPDSQATAVRVGNVRRQLCASPAYLARHGEPKTVAALNDHAVVVVTANAPLPWRLGDGDKAQTVHPRPQLVVNNADLAVSAAEAGLGIVWLLSYQLAASIKKGHLRPILAQVKAAEVPIHIVHLQGRSAPQRTRALVDHLVAGLRRRSSSAPNGISE
jgi:DNA-binding transcriptional LysR family regulator